jgi:hypothetical protein
LGNIPGPIPPNVPIGKSAACQKANRATAITTSPPTKSCRDHMAVGDRDEFVSSAANGYLAHSRIYDGYADKLSV